VPLRTEAFEILWLFSSNNGKDFIFNEDNIVTMSIDNAGRMRFWDIRSLTDPEGYPLTLSSRWTSPHSRTQGFILGNATRQIEVSETYTSPRVLLTLQELARVKV
jgi:hypothetical protein